MSRLRLLPLMLFLLLPAPGSARSAPLEMSDLLRLSSEGVGEVVLLSIVRNQGVVGAVTAERVLEMKRAGWSEALMASVIEAVAASPPPAPQGTPAPSGVMYEERDGAVVARLRGEPETAAERSDRPPASAASPAVPVHQAPAPQIVVVRAPSVDSRPLAADPPEGYPVGAVHGWSGSTVFLPAHFGGDAPSAFGRAIVSTGSPALGYRSLGAFGPPLEAPQDTTLIRTSRGLRRIPN